MYRAQSVDIHCMSGAKQLTFTPETPNRFIWPRSAPSPFVSHYQPCFPSSLLFDSLSAVSERKCALQVRHFKAKSLTMRLISLYTSKRFTAIQGLFHFTLSWQRAAPRKCRHSELKLTKISTDSLFGESQAFVLGNLPWNMQPECDTTVFSLLPTKALPLYVYLFNPPEVILFSCARCSPAFLFTSLYLVQNTFHHCPEFWLVRLVFWGLYGYT